MNAIKRWLVEISKSKSLVLGIQLETFFYILDPLNNDYMIEYHVCVKNIINCNSNCYKGLIIQIIPDILIKFYNRDFIQ